VPNAAALGGVDRVDGLLDLQTGTVIYTASPPTAATLEQLLHTRG